MRHYVYKISFDDGKFYIGVRKLPLKYESSAADNYLGSGSALKAELKIAKPTKTVISEWLSHEVAYALERDMVSYQTLADEKCLNLTLGGRGGFLDSVPLCKRWQRNKEKLAAAVEKTAKHRRGKTKHTDESLARMSRALTGRTKETHSYIQEVSKKLSGRTKHDTKYLAQAGIKISKALKGRKKPKHSELMRGERNPSHRRAIEQAQFLKSSSDVPLELRLKKHSLEMQNLALRLGSEGYLRKSISKQTSIPESTLNAWFSKICRASVL